MVYQNKHQNNDEEPPPILKSWNSLYLIVLLNLAVLIILFYIFTKAFD